VDNHFVHSAGFGSVLIEDGLVEGGIGFILSGDSKDSTRFGDNNNVLVFEDDIEGLEGIERKEQTMG